MRPTRRKAPLDASSTRRAFLGGSVFAAVSAGLAACTTGTTQAAEVPNEIDIGFCQDMAVHHEQALAMCQRVLGRDSGNQVQTLAGEILQGQSYERGMMHTWLQSWGQSTAPPETIMGWMGMSMAPADMPGLATEEQLRALSTTEGLAQGRLFLELMRAHHVGGIDMAGAASGAGTYPVRHIAYHAITTQIYEVEVIDYLLETAYANV